MSDTTEASTEATEDDLRLIRRFNDDDGIPLVDDGESYTSEAEPTPEQVHELIEGSQPSAEQVHRPRTIRQKRDGVVLMLTEIDDGTFVGWDKCSTCNQRVASCGCASGPSPAQWMLKAREKAFERGVRTRIERHLREKLHDSKALSFLEITEIAWMRVTNPLADLADTLDSALDGIREGGGDPLALIELVADTLRRIQSPATEEVEALAVSLEQADRSVLRANLGLKPVKTGVPDVDMTDSVSPEKIDAFIEAATDRTSTTTLTDPATFAQTGVASITTTTTESEPTA